VTARRAALLKSSMTARMPASSSATGSASPSNAIAEAETVVQPPWSRGCEPARRTVSGHTEALRPACASWMPAAAPCERMNRVMRAHASACSSFQRPVS
jgi:hypothetical protein